MRADLSRLAGHPELPPERDKARAAASELLWRRIELPPAPRARLHRRLDAVLRLRPPSPGCRNCLRGRSVSLRMTTRCTRDCFFCFNPRPRRDQWFLEALPIRGLDEAVRRMRLCRLRGVGISGGDPLLVLDRTLRAIRRLRRAFGPDFYVHLYTNGDLASDGVLRRLRLAGLNGIRFNLVANGYRLAPVRRALAHFSDVSVEIPVIPGHEARLEKLIRGMDAVGAPQLILHELCYAAVNRRRFAARGLRAKPCPAPVYISAKPVAGSEELALGLIRYAALWAKRLRIFYCCWSTQEDRINPQGWRWRQAALQASAARRSRPQPRRGHPRR